MADATQQRSRSLTSAYGLTKFCIFVATVGMKCRELYRIDEFDYSAAVDYLLGCKVAQRGHGFSIK